MWYELQIEHCHRDVVDNISEVLENSGAESITLTDKNDDPVLEPEPGTTPLWPDVIIHALFATEQPAKEAQNLLGSLFPDLSFYVNLVKDEDWERVWMNDFKPQQFGERLWVCPSWIAPPEPDAVNLILDPGLAFGTGTHPTTSLCLRWLDQAMLTDKTLIDYGCGSGILALAAIKLGASLVYAVDIDPQALQATRNNAEPNEIPAAQLIIDYPQCLVNPVDVLIANILLNPLLALRPDFHALIRENGSLVVSGILTEQAPALIEAWKPWFQHQQTAEADGWALLAFRRQSSGGEPDASL